MNESQKVGRLSSLCNPAEMVGIPDRKEGPEEAQKKKVFPAERPATRNESHGSKESTGGEGGGRGGEILNYRTHV